MSEQPPPLPPPLPHATAAKRDPAPPEVSEEEDWLVQERVHRAFRAATFLLPVLLLCWILLTLRFDVRVSPFLVFLILISPVVYALVRGKG